MARFENITQLKAVNSSVITGKQWSSGDSMAVEVSENEAKYLGGKCYRMLIKVTGRFTLTVGAHAVVDPVGGGGGWGGGGQGGLDPPNPFRPD